MSAFMPTVPSKEPLSRNVLVYFADWKSQKPLDSLNAALSRVKNSSALMVIVVLPAGTFDASRREVENRLGIKPRTTHTGSLHRGR